MDLETVKDVAVDLLSSYDRNTVAYENGYRLLKAMNVEKGRIQLNGEGSMKAGWYGPFEEPVD